MPLRKEIVDWCKDYPEFRKGLKALYAERFLHLGAVMITHPPGTSDEVIGIYTYDYRKKSPHFKQDFIVDIGGAHKEFVLYSGFPKGKQSSKYVKPINDFFSKYGKNGNYSNTHHLTFDQLPDDKTLRERATKMIEQSKTFTNLHELPSAKFAEDFLKQVSKYKEKKWIEVKKI